MKKLFIFMLVAGIAASSLNANVYPIMNKNLNWITEDDRTPVVLDNDGVNIADVNKWALDPRFEEYRHKGNFYPALPKYSWSAEEDYAKYHHGAIPRIR